MAILHTPLAVHHSRPLPAKPLRTQVCASHLYTRIYTPNNAYQRTKLNKIIYRLWNKKQKKRGKSTDRLCVWAVRSGHGIQEAGPSIYLRTFCRWHLPNPKPSPSPGQGCHGLSGLNKYPLFVASRATITCQFASNFFFAVQQHPYPPSRPPPPLPAPTSTHQALLFALSVVVVHIACRVEHQMLGMPYAEDALACNPTIVE